MPSTKDDVTLQALRELQSVGVGQDASVEDAQAINLKACIAYLNGRGVADLRNEYFADAFPDDLVLPLARFCAARAAVSFGLGLDVAVAMEAAAERDLRALTQVPFVYSPVEADYF